MQQIRGTIHARISGDACAEMEGVDEGPVEEGADEHSTSRVARHENGFVERVVEVEK